MAAYLQLFGDVFSLIAVSLQCFTEDVLPDVSKLLHHARQYCVNFLKKL